MIAKEEEEHKNSNNGANNNASQNDNNSTIALFKNKCPSLKTSVITVVVLGTALGNSMMFLNPSKEAAREGSYEIWAFPIAVFAANWVTHGYEGRQSIEVFKLNLCSFVIGFFAMLSSVPVALLEFRDPFGPGDYWPYVIFLCALIAETFENFFGLILLIDWVKNLYKGNAATLDLQALIDEFKDLHEFVKGNFNMSDEDKAALRHALKTSIDPATHQGKQRKNYMVGILGQGIFYGGLGLGVFDMIGYLCLSASEINEFIPQSESTWYGIGNVAANAAMGIPLLALAGFFSGLNFRDIMNVVLNLLHGVLPLSSQLASKMDGQGKCVTAGLYLGIFIALLFGAHAHGPATLLLWDCLPIERVLVEVFTRLGYTAFMSYALIQILQELYFKYAKHNGGLEVRKMILEAQLHETLEALEHGGVVNPDDVMLANIGGYGAVSHNRQLLCEGFANVIDQLGDAKQDPDFDREIRETFNSVRLSSSRQPWCFFTSNNRGEEAEIRLIDLEKAAPEGRRRESLCTRITNRCSSLCLIQ